MKKFFLLCGLIGLQIIVKAQKVYFIYLQSENATPFYVRLGGQIQSSSTEGYLIVPNLKDSTYQISIGQPGKQAETRFSLTVNKADRGFLIRAVDGTLNLFDLQTLTLYKPVSSETTSTKAVIRTDNFTRLLALVADDSSLLVEPTVAVAVVKEEKASPKAPRADVAVVTEVVSPTPPVAKEVEPAIINEEKSTTATPKLNIDTTEKAVAVVEKPTVEAPATTEPVQKPAQKDSAVKAIVAPKPVTVEESKAPQTPAAETYKKSTITRKSESSTSDGFGLVFLDRMDGVIDTIELVIPNPAFVMPDTTSKQLAADRKFLDISATADSASVAKESEAPKSNLKAQCTSLATDDDFFKLRRDMTARANDEEMIAEAKKYFKVKCYRTEQIKYLTALFLTEESKYQFFDAAFMHVSDQEKFKFLQAELKDNYYINRFKALIAN